MHLFFIDSRKGSKKEEELQNSYARAHAARVAAARTKARRRGLLSGLSTKDDAAIPSESSSATALEYRNVSIRGEFPKPPISPGFGSFRGEMLAMLPSDSHIEDFRALDFFTQVTLPDIDVVNEMFNQGSLFGMLLPSLVSVPRSSWQVVSLPVL